MLNKIMKACVLFLAINSAPVAANVNADVLATSGQGSNILGAIDLIWGSGMA